MDSTHSAGELKSKVALVTGSNKGIGFEIARQFAKAGVLTVLTSRDESRGQAALEALRNEGLNLEYHQLDVTSPSSIETLVDWIQHKFGVIDILVNNAAVVGEVVPADKVASAKCVLDTNYYGVKRVTEAFLPFLNDGASIVNVSSGAGNLEWLPQERWRYALSPSKNESFGMETVEELIREFVEDLEKGGTSENWPQLPFWTSITDYSISKVALNAYTRILARDNEVIKEKRMSVNCMCPGYTKTDMAQHSGDRTPEEGAETAVWLALNPPEFFQNAEFFRDKKQINFEVFNEIEKKIHEGLM